ncbi:hypothetical protein [Actinoplanes sp. NPDC026619]|uniref:hypothetical protein n=1 Tax=Actinoplanes sp. NPDC026619 TaxID=3155798 RepID=UPI0033E2CAFA
MTSEYIRTHARQVQTSVRRYTHPATGRTVTVIGTYHFGKPSYWQSLREMIDKLEANGAVVYCEGSHRAGTDTGADEQEQEVLDRLHRARELVNRRTMALGWTGQIGGLGYPDSWQFVDLSTLEIIRRLGLPLARTIAARQMRAMDWPDTSRSGFNRLRLQIAVMLRVMSSDKRIAKMAASQPGGDVLIKAREEHVLAEVSGGDQDAVLIWGLAHLPGLHDGLAALGFQRFGPPQWHTTIRRRPSILSALLRLVLRWPAPHVPETHQ